MKCILIVLGTDFRDSFLGQAASGVLAPGDDDDERGLVVLRDRGRDDHLPGAAPATVGGLTPAGFLTDLRPRNDQVAGANPIKLSEKWSREHCLGGDHQNLPDRAHAFSLRTTLQQEREVALF